MRDIVVLGGTGFIGRSLVRRLTAEGHTLTVIGRADLDLTARGSVGPLADLLGPTTVLVFASALTPDRDRSVAADRANRHMAITVARAIHKKVPSSCVFISSTAVYGDATSSIDESTPLDPSTPYGRTKYLTERLLRATPVPLICLRPTLVYGPGDTHMMYGPSRLVGEARNGRVSVFGEGDDTRDFVYVDDVAWVASNLLAAEAYGTYNVASGERTCYSDVVNTLIRLRPGLRVEHLPRRVPLSHQYFDISRLRAAVPRYCATPLDVGLMRVWAREG